jgi:light-regulated signal transduction histidine kinase (bacteriophytochrome)
MVDTVLRNLFSNALKFTNPGGSMTISTQSHGEMIDITIVDTGIGISRDNFSRDLAWSAKKYGREPQPHLWLNQGVVELGW